MTKFETIKHKYLNTYWKILQNGDIKILRIIDVEPLSEQDTYKLYTNTVIQHKETYEFIEDSMTLEHFIWCNKQQVDSEAMKRMVNRCIEYLTVINTFPKVCTQVNTKI